MFLRCLRRKKILPILLISPVNGHIFFFARKTAEKKLQQQILKYFFNAGVLSFP